MFYLLFLVPVSVALHFFHLNQTLQFLVAAVAIIPLASYMGEATEEISHRTGPGIGGFLNATLGNAAELIIALIMISKGEEFFDVVKASLTGSVIGNLLLIMGLSMVMGGRKRQTLRFNRVAASSNCSMMFLAVAALLIPAFFHLTAKGEPAKVEAEVEKMSLLISGVLLVTYAAGLWFSLKTHVGLLSEPPPERDERQNISGEAFLRLEMAEAGPSHGGARWSWKRSIGVLVASAVGIGIVSEILVGSLEATIEQFHLPKIFVGAIILALVGNAAEHSAAVMFAMKNKFDLSLNIAVGSSIQIAIFVAPFLVFASIAMGHPMSLEFSPLELLAIILSVLITSQVTEDGETHWLEGVQLLALYFVLAVAFYFAG